MISIRKKDFLFYCIYNTGILYTLLCISHDVLGFTHFPSYEISNNKWKENKTQWTRDGIIIFKRFYIVNYTIQEGHVGKPQVQVKGWLI